MAKKYLVTTPIYYGSGKPHIGHAFTTIMGDTFVSFKKLLGHDAILLSGMDEHGQKIAEKAAKENKQPQEYVDSIYQDFKHLWELLSINFGAFIRTTNPEHCNAVQKVFSQLYKDKLIYLDNWKGLYCVQCEENYTKSSAVEHDDHQLYCKVGHKLVEKSESSYFLQISKFEDWLISFYEVHPNFIIPTERINEIMKNFILPGLEDLSITRTTFDWGIPVTFDPKHVVYVWIDALSNYITNIGYDPDGSSEEFNKWWPADLHLIGKDIIRFHTIYWPIILMALDLPLPKQVFGHPWLLSGLDKMSKSRGNVMYADKLVELFGVDAIRYYVLHEIPFANDGTITYDLIIERINSDLANILGNLVNRTISMANKYFEGNVTKTNATTEFDSDLIEKVNNLSANIDKRMNNLEIGLALDEIFDVLRRSNKYIDETTPWTLAKDETKQDELKTVIYNLLESIRVCAVFLQPFLPQTSEEIFKQINNDKKDESFLDNNEYKTGTPSPLFQRIDKEKKLEEIENNQ